MSKPWYKSRTLWLNAATAVLSVADQVAGTGVGGMWLVPTLGIANMVLRSITTQPLGG